MSIRRFGLLRIRRLRRVVACVAGTGLLLATACDHGEREARLASLRDQRLQLVRQFASVQNAIRLTQAEALGEPGVRMAQDSFYVALRAEMVRLDPGAAAALDEARKVGADVSRLSQPVLVGPDEEPPAGTSEERKAVAQRLKELEAGFRPLVDRAMQAPEVRSRFSALQDSLRAAILRRDTTAATTFARMEDLTGRISKIDSTIATLER